MATTAIDPTVPTNGLPVELVATAQWGEYVDEQYLNGNLHQKKIKYPIINGVHLSPTISETEMAKFIKMFPMVPVYIPITDQEQIEAVKTGRHPAEVVTINGARFTVPKGKIISVHTPIAEVLHNAVNPIRTGPMREYIAKEEFNPLDGNVPFSV